MDLLPEEKDYRSYKERAEDRLKTFIFVLTNEEKMKILQPLRNLTDTAQIRRVFKILHLSRLRALVVLMVATIAAGKEDITTIGNLIRVLNRTEHGKSI